MKTPFSRRPVASLLLAAGLGPALLLATPSSVATDWPHWRGPQGTGVSAESGWSAEFPAAGPKVLWKAEVGTGFSSVTVVGNRAFTMGNKNDEDSVCCLDVATGKVVWQHRYAHPLDPKY